MEETVMATKNALIAAIDDLPLIVKLILCIPAIDIVWGIYRIVKYLEPMNVLMLVISILTIIPGAAFIWILDLICVLLKGKPFLG